MTIQMCLIFYKSENNKLAGLELEIKCYCDNEIKSSLSWSWPTKCDGCSPGDLNQVSKASHASSICFSVTQFADNSWRFNISTPVIILVPSSSELIYHRGEIRNFQIINFH